MNNHTEALEQVQQLQRELETILGSNFIGMYLHGSLAMGCFNPSISDIDLLVRVREAPDSHVRQRLIDVLLDLSCNPYPIELSLLSDANLFPWRHPTPYALHFGEDWRRVFETDVSSAPVPAVDPDLAAHITVLHCRGVVLAGPPSSETFPHVPREDYKDSILRDYEWARERLEQNPIYAVLNMCRVLHYLQEDVISSKQGGGEWALNMLAEDVRPPIASALAYYRGGSESLGIARADLERFVAVVDQQIAGVGECRSS